MADPEYDWPKRNRRPIPLAPGVPLLRHGKPIGAMTVPHAVRPFTDKQIELVQHLRRPGSDRDRERAAVRGGSVAHRRTAGVARVPDCDERSVLEVISRSPFDSSSRCFDAIVETAARLCEAEYALRPALADGDSLIGVATNHDFSEEYRQYPARNIPSPAGTRDLRLGGRHQATTFTCPTAWPIRNTQPRLIEDGGFRTDAWRPAASQTGSVGVIALLGERGSLFPRSRSSCSRPSRTRP